MKMKLRACRCASETGKSGKASKSQKTKAKTAAATSATTTHTAARVTSTHVFDHHFILWCENNIKC